MPLARSIGIGQVAYDDTPTLSELRDYMVTLGLMAAAPPPPTPPSEGVVWEDGQVVWEDEGVIHEDT